VELIENGTISSKIAKEVFEHMWAGEGRPFRDRREARPGADQRHRRDREGHR
jgi:Asp-tRNA(Asn)/Glu-tRNA(Gln) amidotransferase B subunit